MRVRGLLRSMPTRSWCRLIGAFAAYLLSVQAAGVPLLTAEAPASCCCGHGSDHRKCHCKACTHVREVESGLRFLKTCGPKAVPAVVAGVEPTFPAVARELSEAVASRPVAVHGASSPPDQVTEVPTPPPLERI